MKSVSPKPRTKPRLPIVNPYKRRKIHTTTRAPTSTAITPDRPKFGKRNSPHKSPSPDDPNTNDTIFDPEPSDLFYYIMNLSTELAQHLHKMIAAKMLDTQTAEALATTCTKIKDAGGITLNTDVLLFTIFPEHCAQVYAANPAPATPIKGSSNTNGTGGTPITNTVTPTSASKPRYIPSRTKTAQPILAWTGYEKPTNQDCNPFDDATVLIAKLELALGINIQTPFDFAEFKNHHLVTNAIVMALTALDADNTDTNTVLTKGATTFPNSYTRLHMNVNIDVINLTDDLLPPGYTFHRLPGLTWGHILRPTTCNQMINGHEALIYPLILQVAVQRLKTEPGNHTWMSTFVVIHTMANMMIACEHRSTKQYTIDTSNRAYHYFVFGHRIAEQVATAPQQELETTIAKKIGSKIFPILTATQPTQSTNRRGLKILAAHAVLPPNPTPRPHLKHGP